jgi:hypothetical protein
MIRLDRLTIYGKGWITGEKDRLGRPDGVNKNLLNNAGNS